MFIFPVIYLLFFLASVYYIFHGKPSHFLLFVIFGLPVYITTLSICHMYGASNTVIRILQSFKEIVVILTLVTLILKLDRKIKLHFIDWCVIAFLGYNLLYLVLPIGSFGFGSKLLALKSISFFPFIYFTGRLLNYEKINLNEYYHFICLVTIAAAGLLLVEVITYQHFQTYTGYTDFNYYFFSQEPSGNYGLSWTFEVGAGTGIKRFASFFSTPLELGAATLVSTSVVAAKVIQDNNKLRFDKFSALTFICTLFSIFFALSRASFVSYFIMLYAFLVVSGRKNLLKWFHISLLLGVVAVLVWLEGDIYDFIINTVDFSNSSSVSHLIEWAQGINAIINHPLGLGLGTSGRVGASLGENIGGENEYIIIGVQTGVICIALYLLIYGAMVYTAGKMFMQRKGKVKKLALVVLLIKIGLFIPLFTSEAESYLYISYFTWFMAGLLINCKMQSNGYWHRR